MSQDSIEIKEILGIVKRRKYSLFVPMFLIIIVSAMFAYGLPSIYLSSATILIEQQEIPEDLIRSTVTSYASERIQIISKRIMTRDKIEKVVRDIYVSVDEEDIDEIIQDVRENISVKMLSANIINQKTGREGKATIAFTLSFESEDPNIAKKVANEMTRIFLAENKNIRTAKARTTSQFLLEESQRLGKKISELEEKLATFKEENAGKLPELSGLNINLMERAERDSEDVERSIYTLKERKMLMESQLANIDPYTGQSPEVRLKRLLSSYLSAAAIYTSDHPDLKRMRKEIDILKQQTGIDDSAIIINELAVTRERLKKAKEKYSDNHPDLINLEKQVASLQLKVNSLDSLEVKAEFLPKPDNPPYINIQTQIKSIDINLKSMAEKKSRLKVKLDKYEQRLTDMPRVEQAGLSLNRDYQNAIKKYREIKDKQLQANVAEQLESESKGERFTILEAPLYPTKPIKPNRLGILLLGILFAVISGVGLVAVKEILDNTVRGSKKVLSMLGDYPMSVIPYKKIDRKLKSTAI